MINQSQNLIDAENDIAHLETLMKSLDAMHERGDMSNSEAELMNEVLAEMTVDAYRTVLASKKEMSIH